MYVKVTYDNSKINVDMMMMMMHFTFTRMLLQRQQERQHLPVVVVDDVIITSLTLCDASVRIYTVSRKMQKITTLDFPRHCNNIENMIWVLLEI